MSGALTALAGITSLVSVVCWVMTLIKMFGDKEDGGVGKGIGGVICGLYALVWGWQNRAKHNHEKVMQIWGAAIGLGFVFNAIAGAMR